MPDFVSTNDFLSGSSVLRTGLVKREHFNPLNEDHLVSLKHFIRTGNWGDIQFYCEQPFSDVPMTVLMKYAGHLLAVQRETAGERMARICAMDLVRPPTDLEPTNAAA